MADASVIGAIARAGASKALQPVNGRGRGWWPVVHEPYAGAWQQNKEITAECALAYFAVYACITLIAGDIGKLRWKLAARDGAGIWKEVERQPYSRLLRKPNRYQNHIQFKQWWLTSKLVWGNTYALLQRDGAGVVVAEYILDPCRVKPLVADDGSVFYELARDNLSGQEQEAVTVPASEIIHDRMNCLYHPLVGISPLYAAGLAADQGLRIQRDSTRFFSNGANPGGVLSAPGAIGDDTARRLKEHWDNNYTGANAGKVAVLGDGLKFEPMRMSSTDAQLIEQLRWTAEVICSVFHVPPFKIGVGATPTYQNAEVLNQIYYDSCLQLLIEDLELCHDEGLALPAGLGTELDLDGLLRMDTQTQFRTLSEGIKGGVLAPNEARRRVDLPPLTGGDTVYLQQQQFSLAALAKRDALPNPFSPSGGVEPPPDDEVDDEKDQQALADGKADA